MIQEFLCDNHVFNVRATQECYTCKLVLCEGCARVCSQKLHDISAYGIITQRWLHQPTKTLVEDLPPPIQEYNTETEISNEFKNIFAACKTGDIDQLHFSLVKVKSLTTEPFSKLILKHHDHGQNVLHLVSRYGYTAALLMLLHFIEDFTLLRERTLNTGATPLMLVSMGETLRSIPFGRFIVVDVLTKQRHIQDVATLFKSRVDKVDDEKAFQLAQEIVESVAWNRQINIQTFRDELGKRVAKMINDSKLISDLLERRPYKRDKEGLFPKDILYDHRSSLLLLLTPPYRFFIEINGFDAQGMSALHYAILGDRWDFFLILEYNGANTNFTTADTLIHFAADQGSKNCAEMLLTEPRFAITFLPIVVNAIPDSKGYTVLHLVIRRANLPSYLDTLKVILRCVKNYVTSGRDYVSVINQVCFGKTLLHVAVENSFTDAVKLLLIEGANVNAQDDENNTPLHYAAKNGDMELIKILQNAGADNTILNNEGLRPQQLLEQ